MKIKYVDVYHFQVLEEVAEGKTVWVLDKADGGVSCVNDMTVTLAVDMINIAKKQPDRVIFWKDKIETEEEESGEL